MSIRKGCRALAPILAVPLVLALIACIVLPQFSVAQDSRHTRVRLVSDHSQAVPGSSVTIGVLLQMDPGWHTYWVNPGESGLATTVHWTLPEGVTASELQWPLPEKKVEEGDVLTYAYSDETLLLASVHVPNSLPPKGKMKIRADVSWLECQKTCVPGSATVELSLPLGTQSKISPEVKLIDSYRQKLSHPLSEDRQVAVSFIDGADTVAISILPLSGVQLRVSDAGDPDFFPFAEGSSVEGRTRTVGNHDGALVKVPVQKDAQKKTGVHGIIVYTTADGIRQGTTVSFVPGKSGSLLDRKFVVDQQSAGNASIFLYLGLALVGGLLLNVMPCVLPVIALKVFGLVKMAGDEPRRVRRLGWMFSLGILASFLALAMIVILLKVAGQQVGWGFQFQEPRFVIVMSTLVFAFGLSLFGVFEIRLPGVAVAGVSTAISRQEQKGGSGYASSFAEGVFATILATPCTAPFLGTALGFAFAQPTGIILLIFSVVAFGMALPYLLLTARPAWQRFLPKPGAWMETAKQFMGFLMMATLLWLLYVLGKQLGMEGVIWTGAFLLTVGVGCWLIGRFATLAASRVRVWSTWALAAVLAIAGYLIFVESTLDVQAALVSGPAASADTRDNVGEKTVWEPFSPSTLEGHLQKQEAVFLDFTAEWCLTCKVNEKTIIADQRVQDKLQSSGIVTMKADWTNRNPDIARLLSKFGRSGVPLYVVFPAGRPDEPIILPEVLTPTILLEALDRAAPRP
jgi:thiol:disulfide interchange protein/DsbC/DsbD-like thiol-disulfide interchange protein